MTIRQMVRMPGPKSLAVLLACLLFSFSTSCMREVQTIDCEKEPQHDSCKMLSIQNQGFSPRIYVDPPFGLSFSCVLLGCDETRTMVVENRGDALLAISKTRIVSIENHDFSFKLRQQTDDGLYVDTDLPSPQTPLFLAPSEKVEVEVRYDPQDAEEDIASFKLDWFNPKDSYENAVIEKLELALSAQYLGAAKDTITSDTLNFGYISVGQQTTRHVDITNTSTTDVVLALQSADILSEEPDTFRIEPGFVALVNPGDTISVPVTYSPLLPQASFAALQLQTNAIEGSYEIALMGTALESPTLTIVDPLDGLIDFGPVGLGTQHERSLQIRNDGGESASLQAQISLGSVAGFELIDGHSVLLDPLTDALVTVALSPNQGGQIAGELSLNLISNSPAASAPSSATIGLRADVQAPLLELGTPSLSFEPLVPGWVSSTQSIDIKNAGSGLLVIDDIGFEPGSSDQFEFTAPVDMPLFLNPDEGISLPLMVSANLLGPATGAVIFQSNSVDTAVHRVDLDVTIVSCEDACPIGGGTPSCNGGACSLEACDPGKHDSDGDLANGCECVEDQGGNDFGQVCSDRHDLGTLGDNCSSHPNTRMVTGTLHHQDDVDLFFVKTDDAGNAICDTLGDTSETSVELVDGPPGLSLCARIRDPETGCGGYTHHFDASVCGQTKYRHSGSYGSSDDKELTAWVLWKPSASPVCGEYTLRFRGEED